MREELWRILGRLSEHDVGRSVTRLLEIETAYESLASDIRRFLHLMQIEEVTGEETQRLLDTLPPVPVDDQSVSSETEVLDVLGASSDSMERPNSPEEEEVVQSEVQGALPHPVEESNDSHGP